MGLPTVSLDEGGLARMAESRALIDRAIEDGEKIYGVTTGLGARVVETLSAEELASFSVQTVRGRAHAMQPYATREDVRATMIARANTLLLGNSGARPRVAEHLVACLNANVTPHVGTVGSIGVADLLPNASIALALIGEGEMMGPDGQVGPSKEVMASQGISPLDLGPRDGLALTSHSYDVAARAALAFASGTLALDAAQSAAALSMEAFRANLSVIDERPLSLKPLPGQMQAAADLRERLSGSVLFGASEARRVQDPISIRNVPQIHGAAYAALARAREVIEIELNGSSDNPVALIDESEIVSCGLYFTAEICNAMDSVTRAFVHLATAQLARTVKHLNPTLSDLPPYLAKSSSVSTGLIPIIKALEALAGELYQAAQPGPIWPSVNASGVEDCLAGSPVAVKSLGAVADYSVRMSAIEMIVACQALEHRDPRPATGPVITDLVAAIRDNVAPVDEDRPIANEVDALIKALFKGQIV